MAKHDSFLADAVKPSNHHLSYSDGLRFGVGFAIGILLVFLVLGLITWGVIMLLHLG